MLNHVMIGTNDLAEAKEFYTKVLGVLGPVKALDNEQGGIKRVFFLSDGPLFAVTETQNGKEATGANGGTIGFKCSSPEQVKEFHDVAVANGATSIEDAPGKRDTSMGPLHLSYFRDKAGNKICGIFAGG